MNCQPILLCTVLIVARVSSALAQPYGEPDRGQPGDAAIQEYLRVQAEKIHASFEQDLSTLKEWQERREEYRREYLYMLGLWPLPEKTPLKATITGTLEGDGFVVDMIHYQSRPGLYVTANLYRPADVKQRERLPAIFYVCGHSGRGRNGNKTAYQSHGIWFARHGYICLVVDTLQLGEIAALHHGTYREQRWWWHSRGYTPAGVECWNGVRGIDYLVSRSDVDAERIAVTGISGGGASTFWIAAADERVKVAVPVSGMADLPSYVPNRVINGHCDCMFLVNTFQWPWTRIAALVAPRPMLFINSDQDRIFPMDANDRVINRLERLYSLYGASDQVDAVVSIGGHAYREDIRKAVYRFINLHLKNDPTPVIDSEVDLVTGRGNAEHPIDPEKLRVFSTSGIPKDELNTTIDEHFVPMAKLELPEEGEFEPWRASLSAELRRVAFRGFPSRIPPARLIEEKEGTAILETEPGVRVRLHLARQRDAGLAFLVVTSSQNEQHRPSGFRLDPRGVGETRWTRKNPPNFVERSHALLGRTVDAGRVWDIVATWRYLRSRLPETTQIVLSGAREAAVLAAYAALLEPDISHLRIANPPASHMSDRAPQLLNVLRVCDVPEVLGMLAPRTLTMVDGTDELAKRVARIYESAGADGNFHHQHSDGRRRE